MASSIVANSQYGVTGANALIELGRETGLALMNAHLVSLSITDAIQH